RALGTNRQELPIDIHVDGSGVDPGQVRREDVMIAEAVQVHGHLPGSPPTGIQERARQTLELAERIVVSHLDSFCHGHPFPVAPRGLSHADSTTRKLALSRVECQMLARSK